MNKFSGDFIQYSDEKVKDETKHLALYFVVHISLYIVLLFFLIFFAWYTVFISTHNFYAVTGPSMMPTLNADISDPTTSQNVSFDAVYVDKITEPKIFDIIVVKKEDGENVIKRLLATSGDYITIAKGSTEDGKERFYFYRIPNDVDPDSYENARLDEDGESGYKLYDSESLWIHHSYANDPVQNFNGWDYEKNFYDTYLSEYESGNENYYVDSNGLIFVKVPENCVFYMGDNREYSTDCRQTGFREEKYVVGRAEFIVYDYNFANRLLEVVKFYFREMEEFFAR